MGGGQPMSRIRSIHPGIHTDEAYAALSHAAWRLAIGIWNECDDQGAFEWKPVTLKMRILPASNDNVAALLAELEAGNIVRKYEHGGREYGLVRNFRKYQRPKKPNSTHFVPAEFRTYVGLSADGSEKRKQMEEGGGNKTEPIGSEKGSRIPEDFKPDPAEAQALGLPLALALSEAERFRDYWIGVPGQRGRKRDWPATWRNWCRKVADDKGLTPKSQANDNEDWTWVNEDDPAWDAWADAEERETGERPKPGLGRNGHGNWFEARFRARPAA